MKEKKEVTTAKTPLKEYIDRFKLKRVQVVTNKELMEFLKAKTFNRRITIDHDRAEQYLEMTSAYYSLPEVMKLLHCDARQLWGKAKQRKRFGERVMFKMKFYLKSRVDAYVIYTSPLPKDK